MKNTKSYKIALGSICLALTIVSIFLATIIPGVELTLYAIGSVFIGAVIIETNIKNATLIYIAAVLLGLLILPNKSALIPYIFFFGYYGIVKFLIEKFKSKILQLTMKFFLYSVVLSIALIGFKKLLLGSISLPNYPIYIILILGILFLFLYDFIYTSLINLYINRIKNKGGDNIKLS